MIPEKALCTERQLTIVTHLRCFECNYGAILFQVLPFVGNKKEVAGQILSNYDQILTHLKPHRALLNVVKPHYLLDLEDFRLITQTRAAKFHTLDEEHQVEQ